MKLLLDTHVFLWLNLEPENARCNSWRGAVTPPTNFISAMFRPGKSRSRASCASWPCESHALCGVAHKQAMTVNFEKSSNYSGAAVFLLPLQGEGRDGDGVIPLSLLPHPTLTLPLKGRGLLWLF